MYTKAKPKEATAFAEKNKGDLLGRALIKPKRGCWDRWRMESRNQNKWE